MLARTILLLAAALIAAPAHGSDAAERAVGDLGKVGTVRFATSCDPSVQAEFDRGVALLHSFFFAEARRIFEGIAERDPECAMAHWGVAMSHYHMIWAPPDSSELAAGLAAAQRAAAADKQGPREKAFIQAILAYYEADVPAPPASLPAVAAAPSCHASPGGPVHRGRAACFLREIEKVTAAYPEDVDAAAFYALSLLGNAPEADPKLANQTQAAKVLESWYAKQPEHPGLVHYLIHSYDYPQTAARGLDAALAYADIAPWVPHALHMPSHIFTRLGMWQESIESNLASAAAGRTLAPAPNVGYFEELHALDYAIYGYLQTGRDGEARTIVERIESLEGTHPPVDWAAAYAFGAIPARYALERRQWREAANLEARDLPFWRRLPFAKGHILYARAVGAAKSGDVARARAAADELGALAGQMGDPRFAYFARQAGIQRRAAEALLAFAEGRRDHALEALRVAAAEEDSLGKSPVSPGAMLPVRELYAEALLDAGRAVEALAEFERSLETYPRRFNGHAGAARAAAKSANKAAAKRHYEHVLELAGAASPARPEIAEAKAWLGRS